MWMSVYCVHASQCAHSVGTDVLGLSTLCVCVCVRVCEFSPADARVPALARQVSRKSCSPTSRNLIPPGQTVGSAIPTHTFIEVGRFPCKGPTCPRAMNVTVPALLQLSSELV